MWKYASCRTIVAIGMACVTGPIASSVAARAQGQQPVSIGNVSATEVRMPAGDHSTPTSEHDLAAYRNQPPRRIPKLALTRTLQRQSIAARLVAGAGAQSADGTQIYPTPSAGPTPQSISGTTCTTNSSVGFAPSDIHGAVGLLRQVVVTNVEIGVYFRETCALVSKVSLKSFFNVTNPAETLFDPRVIYDKRANRFFVTVESRNSGNSDQFQYFAVSTNSAGTTWYKYSPVGLSVGASAFCKSAANSFWDYPSAGVNRWRWFITANDFGASTTGSILMINKTPTLTGASTQLWCWSGQTFNIAPPDRKSVV